MSENVDIARAAMEAFNDRDLDRLVALCDERIDWTVPPELPGSRTYHGHDGVREALGDMVSIFPDLHAEPRRFIEDGERVIGLYLWRGTAGGSGASLDPFEVQAGFICDFEDGLAKSIRFSVSWETTLSEAGVALEQGDERALRDDSHS